MMISVWIDGGKGKRSGWSRYFKRSLDEEGEPMPTLPRHIWGLALQKHTEKVQRGLGEPCISF